MRSNSAPASTGRPTAATHHGSGASTCASYGLRHTDVTVTKPDGALDIAKTLLGKLTSVDAIGSVAFTSSRAALSVASGPVPGVSSKTTDGPFTSRRYTSWRVLLLAVVSM